MLVFSVGVDGMRSRDHSTRGGRLPTGGPLRPCVYLTLLWRYGASKTYTDTQTHAHTRNDGLVQRRTERPISWFPPMFTTFTLGGDETWLLVWLASILFWLSHCVFAN